MRLEPRRHGVIALGTVFALVALALAIFSFSGTTRVSAADPSVFTSVGCAIGNYSCVRANGGTIPPEPGDTTQFTQDGCAVGNFSCLAAAGVTSAPQPASPTVTAPPAPASTVTPTP